MSEKLPSTVERGRPERHPGNIEHLERPAHHEGLESAREQRKRLEKARSDAEHEARFAREIGRSKPEQDNAQPGTIAVITKQDREEGYNRTMRDVRAKLNAPQRVFSSFIHAKVIEKTSDVVASTIARPNSLLFGGLFAFVGVLGLYGIARYNGFALSGFETIAAFIVGWLFGIVFDFLRAMITGKR